MQAFINILCSKVNEKGVLTTKPLEDRDFQFVDLQQRRVYKETKWFEIAIRS